MVMPQRIFKELIIKFTQTQFFVVSTCIVAILFLFGLPQISRAGFDDDYQNFLKVYDSYRTADQNYLTTRNQYLTYNTLTAKSDALAAVKTFLTDRNQVLLSYTTLLLERNADQTYGPALNNETNFLNQINNQIPAVGSLDDAVQISGQVEGNLLQYQTTSRQIVGSIVRAKIDSIRQNVMDLENQAGVLITQIKATGKDTSTLERWLLDAKNKELLGEQKLSEVQTKITNLSASSVDDLNSQYNQIQFTLFEANQYYKETLNFLAELSDSMKYGQY